MHLWVAEDHLTEAQKKMKGCYAVRGDQSCSRSVLVFLYQLQSAGSGQELQEETG